jgi:hypothetical protein
VFAFVGKYIVNQTKNIKKIHNNKMQTLFDSSFYHVVTPFLMCQEITQYIENSSDDLDGH